MSDSADQPWSNHPNAPQIPYSLYLVEKELMAGDFLGAISYGIVIALFFQCMRVLLTPNKTIKTTVKWALVVHTMAMFLFITVPVGIHFDWLSIGYINNREFPGNDESAPGPFGYEYTVDNGALGAVYQVMFPLNQWLADGLLLHRCCVIYSMNHWVMAFPYLIYLASVALGISHVYEGSGTKWETAVSVNFSISYLSISLGLNVLLTLMIVTRLIWARRNLRGVVGASDGSSGPYKAIITMIIESYALYAVALLAYTIPGAADSFIADIFSNLGGTMQVIAPYLIILRVAKRRAVTSESISGSFESMQFRSQGSTDVDDPLPDGDPTTATEVNGESHRELAATDDSAIEEVPL